MIIEAVGLPATQAQAVAAAKKGAQVLMFGVGPQEAHFEMNTYDIYKKQLTIQGSFINPLTFKDAISLLESGKMNVAPLISHELGLEEVQDFLDGKIQGVSKAPVLRTTSRQRKEEVPSHGFRRQYSLAAGFPFFFRRPHFSLHHLY